MLRDRIEKFLLVGIVMLFSVYVMVEIFNPPVSSADSWREEEGKDQVIDSNIVVNYSLSMAGGGIWNRQKTKQPGRVPYDPCQSAF